MSKEKRKPARRSGSVRAPHINCEKIERRRKEKGMTKTALAQKAGLEYRSLSNALRKEHLTYYYVDKLGRALDLAPEEILDEIHENFFPDDRALLPYSFHLKQHTTPFSYVTETLSFMTVNPEALSKEQYVELSVLIYENVSKKLSEWGLR
jgi:lambda repressor-like predicted transcriptional regulator